MSLYNILFGRNGQSGILLAVVGMKECDVERFRNVGSEDDGKVIAVYSRTGGGNREYYPQQVMRHLPAWSHSTDDEFDSTYCTDYLMTPDGFSNDVSALSDVLSKGIRAEFAQHIAKTINREQNERDISHAEYEHESETLRRTPHFMANGHTFVPQTDHAMMVALKLAEARGGELRSCWGIAPLRITVKTDYEAYPNAKPGHRGFKRVHLDTEWETDTQYWEHCVEMFGDEFPLSIAKIAEDVDFRERKAKR